MDCINLSTLMCIYRQIVDKQDESIRREMYAIHESCADEPQNY